MKTIRFYIAAALLAMLPVLASCRQELCYDHFPALDVNFTWEQEWERDYGHNHSAKWDAEACEADYDELRPDIPEWINAIRFFDGDAPEKHFLKPEGARMIIDADRDFSMLLYNGDTEYIVLSDVVSLNDARASASSRSRGGTSLGVMFDKHNTSRTTNPPDILYSAYIDHVPGLKNHEQKSLPVKMQPLVYTYLIIYEFEYGLQHVALARGAIGGMAESVYLRNGVTSEEASIILFDCDIKSRSCQARVRSFGAPGFPDKYYGRALQSVDRPYSLNLEVRLKNGKTLEFDYDISDQMKYQPRGGVIKISGLRIEDEQNQVTGGFEVDVSEWDDNGQIIDLPMGNQPGAVK